MTQLESLSNDLLLDLFEYFDTVELLRIFSCLNIRFHTLIYKEVRRFHLDLQHISKPNFDVLCHDYLRSIGGRITSCCLADTDETPGLVDLFYSRGFHINQFLSLQALTLIGIRGRDIACMLDGLVHLVDLNISKCTMSPGRDHAFHLIDRIWSRPKLRHCKLCNNHVSGSYFSVDTVISATLEHLTIQCPARPLTSQDLSHLLSITPRLRVLFLNVDLADEEELEKLPAMRISIRTIKLTYHGGVHSLSQLLQGMPNLHHLSIHLIHTKMDGQEWQRLINKHAPQLQTLRFEMLVYSRRENVSDQEIDALLDTFRTPFWLHERQWYVRCDVEHGRLYTVPFALNSFTVTLLNLGLYIKETITIRPSKWTCPDEPKYWLSDRVRSFDCKMQAKNSSYLYPASFPNLHKLTLRIPSHETICRFIPSFSHLTTLHISFHDEGAESQLQALFDQARHLYTLTFDF